MTARRLGVIGAAGRMGRSIIALLPEFPHLQLAAAVERSGHAALGETIGGVRLSDDLGAALRAVEVVVDFSHADCSVELLRACADANVACLIGTTGHGPTFSDALNAAARRIPVLQTANTSAGVNVLLSLVRQAARSLPDFDIEIVEAHHRHKLDAPSGTALALGRAAAEARGADFERLRAGAREARAPRRGGEIGFASLRGGDIAGDHTVVLAGIGERLELKHQATDRSVFARGALRAAAWLVERPAGCYSMADVFSLKT
ncbi:MAG: 4-hydroxy-tetrahydrodipicolinate reductase [Steroidobacteraceae bacterium]|nr:4-hydroxy-tetrahydrodipicolinate reductase [Steroidobacteraceae bacterium]MDW8260384.1 4-hydroxy-tetrahydrodipicolinate reductase [Gammaproteobacteria bacterium]